MWLASWWLIKKRRAGGVSAAEVGTVGADTVVVTWRAAIESGTADYTLGVTITVNGTPATITSAARPSTTETRYALSADVQAGDVVTFAYDSGPGDLTYVATGLDVATIAARSVTNNVTLSNNYDFSQAANSQYVPLAF